MWIDIQVAQRVVQSWYFKSLIWGISSRFPLANHLALPGSGSVLVYLRVLSCVHGLFLTKMDSSKQTYEKGDIFLFLVFLCKYSWNVFLDLKNEKYVVSYLGRA